MIKKSVQEAEVANYISSLENHIIQLLAQKNQPADEFIGSSEDKENGTTTVAFHHPLEALSDTDIYKECKRDPLVWKLVQVWKKKRSNGFIYSANFRLLEEDEEVAFQRNFIDFLSSWTPREQGDLQWNIELGLPTGMLVINRQDFHFNKLDIFGDNDVDKRLKNDWIAVNRLVKKASRNCNLQRVDYIVGSDCFNSEWTGTTTKGTPQTNVFSYEEGFEKIVAHEIQNIKNISKHASEVRVIFVPGNHDRYVGWHLIKMLETYFSNHEKITFDTRIHKRKYFRFSNTAIMYNHGDDAKPQKLANAFPVEFKEEWSKTDHWYIFTGDKHTPLEKSFSGIEFFGISALSTAKSNWDDMMANLGKAAYTAYLIEEGKGISDIYKEIING